MSLQPGPSLLCSGTSSPTDIFATHLLLHHPGGKDLLNDIGIILGRLLGTGKVNSFFLAHHVPLALSQHRMAACFSPSPPAGKTETALGAGRAVLGEPPLGPRVQVLPAQLHSQPVLFRSARPQHCWVFCVHPSSYTGAAREGGKSPRKDEGASALLPMNSRKEICQNAHTPAPRHSPCHILVMPWQLYSPIVLQCPKGFSRTGGTSVRPCHMSPTCCHLPVATGHEQQHLTGPLSMQLFLAGSKCCLLPSAGFYSVPRDPLIDALCWHPGAPSTALLAEHRLCSRWP